ncbi:MAG: hypothetical protein M0T85_10125 [Dehalococcoidales bacterium]|nr:hypothetical protein [Dehalococcoidales bacterium]
MDNGRVKSALDIRDKQIAEELFWRVEEGLRARGEQRIKLDPMVDDLFNSALIDDTKLKIRYSIERAEFSLNSMKVDIQLRPARSVVDRVLERIRRPLHELVVFYVGLMANRQKVFNARAILALQLFSEAVQRPGNKARLEEAAELRAEVERLRTQIEQLEGTVERLVRDKGEATTARQDIV